MKDSKDKRIEKLEEKLDALARHLGVSVIAEEQEDDYWWVEVVKNKRNRFNL